jgi:chromosome segregation ATPase
MYTEPSTTSRPSRPPPGPALVVLSGPATNKKLLLNRTTIVIGNNPACDIKLNSPEISDVHCLIVQSPEGISVRDCKSRTGTLINNEFVTEQLVKTNDIVQVGPFPFRVVIPEGWSYLTAYGQNAPAAATAATGRRPRDSRQRKFTQAAWNLRRRWRGRNSELAEVQKRTAALLDQQYEQFQALKRRSDQHDGLKAEAEKLRAECAELERQLKEAREAAPLPEEVARQVRENEAQRDALGAEIAEQMKRLEAARQERDQMAKELAQFHEDWTRRENEVSAMEASHKAELESFLKAKADWEAERAAFETSFLQKKEELEKLSHGKEALIAEHQERLAEQERKLAEVARKEAALQEREEGLANQRAAIQRETEHWLEQRNALSSELEAMRAELENLQAQCRHLKAEQGQLEGNIAEWNHHLDQERRAWERELEQLRKSADQELAAMRAQVQQDLQRRHAAAEDHVDKLYAEAMENLEQMMAALQSEVSNFEELRKRNAAARSGQGEQSANGAAKSSGHAVAAT